METLETDVLVVGAGPVGLALAGDLGWRSVRCLLIERGTGAVGQPKTDLVGIRTMEFCRRWGLTGDVESSAYNRAYPQDNVCVTTLNGFELGRVSMPSMEADRPPAESPAKRERCPQNVFDPILRRFVQRQASVELRHEHELLSFDQDAQGVRARVRDLKSGADKLIHARYLVGCDGARSRVREGLGIGMYGKGVLTHTINVVFECEDFNHLHDKAPGYRYLFVGPRGIWASIVAIDGRKLWRMSVIAGREDSAELSADELRALACQALGRPFDPAILSVLSWTRRELVARSYGHGRAFIAGDACHLISSTGGLGMNTGIGDAVDVAWKLDAVLKGWGGPALLASYAQERRPVAERITRFSTGNLTTMKRVPTNEHIAEDSAEGQKARALAGAAILESLHSDWFSLNAHLGERYLDSPVCLYTEAESPDSGSARSGADFRYQPSTRVGVRAPHVWLADGTSILDCYGRGFVLVLSRGAAAGIGVQFADRARQRCLPLRVLQLQEPVACAVYDRPYVLVRPDGHIAWSERSAFIDVDRVLALVSGH